MRKRIQRRLKVFVPLFCLFILSACGTREAAVTPLHTSTSPANINSEPPKKVKEDADIFRNDPEISPYLSDPAFTAVTREHGLSVIKVRDLPFKSSVAAAPKKPWSSWWYPKIDDFMFRDRDEHTLAPLTKYDKVRMGKFKDSGSTEPAPSSAAEFEQKLYNPSSLAWEGLCDAWALSSILEKEPRKPVTYIIDNEEITFTVADLKALLLKTYEAVDDSGLKFYGQKFMGDERGWIYPDIFPDQFHRLLEVQLFERKRPFIMDHDPGPQVWNVPVYKANFLMENVPQEPDSILVTAWVYYANSIHSYEKDFIGTKVVLREYQYILKGKRDAIGNLVVTTGQWVKGSIGVDSRKDHPDYVIQLPDSDQLTRKSLNPEIDIKLVDEILSQSYE